jgi:HEAT repeat protein
MNLVAIALMLFVQESDLARLLRELDHDEIQRRDRAVAELRRLTPEDPAVDRALDELVEKGTPELAKLARQVQRFRLAARIVPDPDLLMDRLASPSRDLRAATLNSLLSRGGLAAPIARDLLADPEHSVRQVALQIVIASDSPAYLPDVRALIDDPNLGMMVLPWLAARHDISAAPPLRRIADTPNANAAWAIEQLAKLRQAEDIDRVRVVLNEPQQAGVALRAIRSWDEAKRRLATEIRLMAGLGVTEAVLIAADSRDPSLAPLLKELCRKENNGAAFALGTLGDRDAVPFLLKLVRYRRLNSAIGLLGRLKAREAVPLFRRMLAETQPPESRDRAAYAGALGEIGGPDAEDLLLKLLDDVHEEVRYEAASALGRLKCARATPQLLLALDDAVAFSRPLPIPADAPVLDLYDGRSPGREWRQGREAAAVALSAIHGVKLEGSLDAQVAALRAWGEARK